MKKYIIEDVNLPSSFTYGIEIECGLDRPKFQSPDFSGWYHLYEMKLSNEIKRNKLFALTNDDTEYAKGKKWKIGSDGSVRFGLPFEIKSPILCGDNGLKQIETICKILKENKFKVNKSCGLHVHIGVENFSKERIKSVIALYGIFEKQISQMLDPQRNKNRYCQKLIDTSIEKFLEKLNSNNANDLSKFTSHYTRVNARKLTQINTHKQTIEFRQHQGTIKYNDISNWIKFIYLIVRASGSKQYYKQKNYEELLKNNKSKYKNLEKVLDKDIFK